MMMERTGNFPIIRSLFFLRLKNMGWQEYPAQAPLTEP